MFHALELITKNMFVFYIVGYVSEILIIIVFDLWMETWTRPVVLSASLHYAAAPVVVFNVAIRPMNDVVFVADPAVVIETIHENAYVV